MLTEKQAEVLGWIRRFIQEHGFPPTRKEIADGFGWRSSNNAEEHLRALERQGYLELRYGRARGIVLLSRGEDHMQTLPDICEALYPHAVRWRETVFESNAMANGVVYGQENRDEIEVLDKFIEACKFLGLDTTTEKVRTA